jgi:hypothetical protein
VVFEKEAYDCLPAFGLRECFGIDRHRPGFLDQRFRRKLGDRQELELGRSAGFGIKRGRGV